jgi:hypothetical protein
MSRREKHSSSTNVLKETGFSRICREPDLREKTRLFTTFIEERLNRVDVFGVVELVEVAAAAKIENKPEADQILNVVSDYLSCIDEPILKTLISTEGKVGQNTNLTKLRQAMKTVQAIKNQMDINKKQEMFGGKNTYILRFINDIDNHIGQISSDYEGEWSLIPINGYGRNDAKKTSEILSPLLNEGIKLKKKVRLFDEGINHKEKLLRAVLSLMKGLNKNNIIQQLAHLPIYIIEKLQDVSEPNIYWDKQYGGFSLRQIFTTTNPDILKNNFLIFLQYVPRGDIFWHTIIEAGLLGQFSPTDEDGIHKTNNSATLLGFQYSIATALLFSQFTKPWEVADILKVFYKFKIPIIPLLNTLESSYYFYLTYISKNEEIFPEELIYEFMEEKRHLPALLTDELVDWYLKRNINKIQAYLMQNAPSEQIKNDIRQWTIEKKRFNYTESHTQEILTSIRYIMGDQLWNMLFIDSEKQQKTEEVIDDIVNSILKRKLWPKEEIDRVEKFDKGSLPYMFGIDNIKFRFDPANPNIMAAAIQLRVPRSIALLASIQNIGGNLEISFSIDPKENKEILQLLKLLVAVELEDNLADIKLENGFQGKKSTSKQKRQRFSNKVSSGQLVDRLNAYAIRKDKEFKPRTVKCHERHLGGAKNYLEAVENYQKFISQYNINQLPESVQAEYDSIVADLRITLGQRDMISDRKEQLIPSLSDEVREKMILVVDPIDKKERWVHTWIISYVSPAPDPANAGNLKYYYYTYIRGNEGPRSAVYNPLLVQLSNEVKK